MNIFYKNVSKKHLQKLIEERDYYISSMEHSGSEETREAYRLMADFYSTLIRAAEKHISENS